MSQKLTVALAQINTTADVGANLAAVHEYARRAAEGGASLVVFPEATMVGFGNDLLAAARNHAEQWRTEMMWLASELELTVVVGEFAVDQKDPAQDGTVRVRNLLVAYTPEGERFEYAKIHLYDAFGFSESDTVSPGEELVTVPVAGTSVGLTLCYDIRFPKLYAELSRAGAEVILCAASWGAGPGKVQQWSTLARARALDSNTVVVAAGQADPEATGADVAPDAPTGVGFSVVADPFGEAIAQLDAGEALEIVEIDLGVVERARKAIPVLENARLGY